MPCDSDVQDRFGDIFNLVYLKSDAAGRLIGHFTMYNTVGWQIVLTESGAVPDVGVGLVSNPLKPAEWSDTVADDFNIEFNWLDNPTYGDFNKVQERFVNVVRHHFEGGRPRETGKIVDGTCGRQGLSENDPIPDDRWEEIIAEIADQVAHYAVGLTAVRKLRIS